MTPKERAVMQQALEALEVYGEHAKDCPQYPTYTRPQDYPKCDCGFDQAITALREALAEPDMNLNCKSVQKRLATSWGYVKAEQAEQEPVAFKFVRYVDGKEMAEGVTIEREKTLDAAIKKAVALCQNRDKTVLVYAAPVRTKDLTADEILDVALSIEIEFSKDTDKFVQQLEDIEVFARAVIAKFKEKNK